MKEEENQIIVKLLEQMPNFLEEIKMQNNVILEDSENNVIGILPPPSNCCQICGVEHDERLPHNAQSFYYQYLFNAQYGRGATWDDAMSHCSNDIKKIFTEHLNKLGIDPKDKNVHGNFKSQEEIEERLRS